MKRLRVAVLAMLVAGVAPVAAQIRDGAYAIVGAGQADYVLQLNCLGANCERSNERRTGYRLGGGYSAGLWAGELVYLDHGRAGGGNDSLHTTALSLGGVMRGRPFGPVELALRLGAARVSEHRVSRGVASRVSSWQANFGVAVGADVGPASTLELGLDFLGSKSVDYAFSTALTLSLRQRF